MAEKLIKPWEREDEGEGMSWSSALIQGGQNLPISTVRVGRDIAVALSHPIETGSMILKLMQGTLHLLLPDEIQQKIDPEGKTEESQQLASAVGQHFQEKYGGEDNIKHAIANDPATVLMDIAVVLTGGGMLLTKTGQLSKIAAVQKAGEVATKTATYVDPLVGTLRAGAFAANKGGKLVGEYAGAVGGTGTGSAHTVAEARLGAKEGAWLKRGERGEQLTTAMRGSGDLADILQIALRDLEVMKTQKQANYRANKELWTKDESILNFEAIEKALENADNMVKFKGQVINQKAADAAIALRKMVDDWKALDPKTFHTPEGLDKLKQQMWSVVEGVPIENATAVALAKNIYHATKDTIAKQAPGYAKAMKEYTEASELILQLEKTLSLGSKAQIDTAIRKLNSLMRDNVNTNYGQRMKLARQLEEAGGEFFMPGLAGHQMNSWMPRNIQGAVLPAMTGGAALTGGASLPSAAAMMAVGSPRIVGEAANAIGYTLGKLDKLPRPSYQGIEGMMQLLYQAQSAQEQKRNR